MSHRGIPAREIDSFDETSLRGLPSSSIGAEPIISLRTVLWVVAIVAIAAVIIGFSHR